MKNYLNKPIHGNYHKYIRFFAEKTTNHFSIDQSDKYPNADRKYDYYYSGFLSGFFAAALLMVVVSNV